MSIERKPSPRLTEKERDYRALLAEHAASGKSLTEFAAAKGLVPATVAWWRGELRRREAIRHGRAVPRRRSRRRRETVLVPVTLADPPAGPEPSGVFEVSLPGGAAVRVPFAFDVTALKQLVAVLREAC